MGGTNSSQPKLTQTYSQSLVQRLDKDGSKRLKRASKADVLPQYFTLLKIEHSKKYEKTQRRINKLKREEDEFQSGGKRQSTEPSQKNKRKNWVMEIYNYLKRVHRSKDPHCQWAHRISERLKRFHSFNCERWKSDLFWQEYSKESRSNRSSSNKIVSIQRASLVSTQTVLTTKDSEELESISQELQAGRYTKVLEKKLTIIRSHLDKEDHPIAILIKEFEESFFECYCQYLQSNEDLLRESITKFMITCHQQQEQNEIQILKHPSIQAAFKEVQKSKEDDDDAEEFDPDCPEIFCSICEKDFRKFIVELAILDCQHFIEAVYMGFLAFYDIELSVSDISKDLFVNEITNKVLANNTYLLLFSLLSKANGEVIQKIESVMDKYRDLKLNQLVTNPYFQFDSSFRQKMALSVSDLCLLPDQIQTEKEDLSQIFLKDCVEIVRSVRDLESPYSKISHFFKLNTMLLIAIEQFWSVLPELPPKRLEIDTETLQDIYLYLVIKSQYSKLWTEYELARKFMINSLEFSNKSYFFTTLKLAINILENNEIEGILQRAKECQNEEDEKEEAIPVFGSPLSPQSPDIFDIMMRSESRRSTSKITQHLKQQKVKLSSDLKATMYKMGSERQEKQSLFRNTLQYREDMSKTVVEN